MLKLLGVPYVESNGEAEALCAWLNAKGVRKLSSKKCGLLSGQTHIDRATAYLLIGAASAELQIVNIEINWYTVW